MPLIDDIRNDIREARKIRLPWWGVLCWMAICGLIVWLLVKYGRFDLALPTLNSLGIVGFAVAVKRQLVRQPWFVITMTVLAALHIPLILFVPWTTRWIPAFMIAVIDSADLVVMLAILAVVRRFVGDTNVAGT
jgi:hypothetical protein